MSDIFLHNRMIFDTDEMIGILSPNEPLLVDEAAGIFYGALSERPDLSVLQSIKKMRKPRPNTQKILLGKDSSWMTSCIMGITPAG
jgi:hypothetical protein